MAWQPIQWTQLIAMFNFKCFVKVMIEVLKTLYLQQPMKIDLEKHMHINSN